MELLSRKVLSPVLLLSPVVVVVVVSLGGGVMRIPHAGSHSIMAAVVVVLLLLPCGIGSKSPKRVAFPTNDDCLFFASRLRQSVKTYRSIMGMGSVEGAADAVR